MRVAHIFPFYGKELIGGGEIVEYRLSKGISQLGAEVDVYTTKSNNVAHTSAVGLRWPNESHVNSERVDGVNIFRYPTISVPRYVGYLFSLLVLSNWIKEGINLPSTESVEKYIHLANNRNFFYDYIYLAGRGPYCPKMYNALKLNADKYDVMLAGFIPFKTLQIVWKITKINKKPFIIIPFFHPDDVYHHWKIFYTIMKDADAVLTLNDYTKDLLINHFNANAITVGAGIDIEQIDRNKPSEEAVRDFKKKHSLTESTVLMVGRKETSKNYEIVIDAVNELENVKLLMAGKDIDKKDIKNVLYFGEVTNKELSILYEVCDALVLASKFESFGIVLLEAWYRKKPVIGNANCNPVKCMISDGQDGLLFSSKEELKQRINDLVTNKETARKYGEAGYNKVVNRYDWKTICMRVMNIYEKVLSEKRTDKYAAMP